MAIWIEPTDHLNAHLKALPEGEATRVWNELEALNLRLGSLLQQGRPTTTTAEARAEQLAAEQLAIEVVCRYTGVNRGMLFAPERHSTLIVARGQLAALLQEELKYTHQRIATVLRRDRTTVRNAILGHEDLLATDTAYRNTYAALVRAFRQQRAPSPAQFAQPRHNPRPLARAS